MPLPPRSLGFRVTVQVTAARHATRGNELDLLYVIRAMAGIKAPRLVIRIHIVDEKAAADL